MLAFAVVGTLLAFRGPLATGNYSDMQNEVRLMTYPVVLACVLLSTICFLTLAISLLVGRRATWLLYGISGACVLFAFIGTGGAWTISDYFGDGSVNVHVQGTLILLTLAQLIGFLGVLLWWRVREEPRKNILTEENATNDGSRTK